MKRERIGGQSSLGAVHDVSVSYWILRNYICFVFMQIFFAAPILSFNCLSNQVN